MTPIEPSLPRDSSAPAPTLAGEAPGRAGKFRDAAHAHQHGELRVAVDTARNMRRGGWGAAGLAILIVAGLGRRVSRGFWWSTYRQAHPLTFFGSVLRITLHSGHVITVPWEVVAAAAVIPIGIAVGLIGTRRLKLSAARFAKEFPNG